MVVEVRRLGTETSLLGATLRALVRPTALIVAAATALLAVFSSSYWIVPGAMLYGSMVLFMGPVAHKRRQLAIELGLDIRDAPPGLRRWNSALNDALRGIYRDLDAADGDARRLLEPVREEVQALGADIRQLIRRAATVHRYLRRANPAALTARITALQAQASNTADSYSRQQLTEARDALQQQQVNCEQLRTVLSRAEATLENMQASLQSIGSSVAKISAGGVTDAQMARDDSLTRLASARSTVAALEEVLETVQLA